MTDLPLAKSGRSALEVATEATKQAGEILLAHFYAKKETKDKGKGHLVTEIDISSERLLLKFLKEEYPDFNILSEELAPTIPVTGYTWIVDPLAGTNNYAFGIPFFGINMALAKNEDILLGVTYDPLRKELFWAEKGKGAYLNHSPIRVSEKVSLEMALLGFDPGNKVIQGEKVLSIVTRFWPRVHGLRAFGTASVALAYVACGRLDLYLRRGLYPWDMASGILLVREAGGEVSDWQGRLANLQSQEIIAANHKLHQALLPQLR